MILHKTQKSADQLAKAHHPNQGQISPKIGLRTTSSTTVFSLIKNAEYNAFATSSGITNREGGKSTPAQLSVKVAPGNMAVTRTPYGIPSNRSDLLNPSMANLETE
jgi:hypothetical protein